MTDNEKPSLNINGVEIKRLAEDALQKIPKKKQSKVGTGGLTMTSKEVFFYSIGLVLGFLIGFCVGRC